MKKETKIKREIKQNNIQRSKGNINENKKREK